MKRIENKRFDKGTTRIAREKTDIWVKGRGGIIIFDKIGGRSNIRPTAASAGVTLIQIRDNKPLIELHQTLTPVAVINMASPPVTNEEIDIAVLAIPAELFILTQEDLEDNIDVTD